MWSTKSRMNLWIYDWSVKPILNSTSAFWPNKTEPRDWCWSNSCHLRPETIAHSSTSSLRRLPLSRIPNATNGIPSKCVEFQANWSRLHSDQIPLRTITDEIGAPGFGQSLAIGHSSGSFHCYCNSQTLLLPWCLSFQGFSAQNILLVWQSCYLHRMGKYGSYLGNMAFQLPKLF